MRKPFNEIFDLRADGVPFNIVPLGIASTVFPVGTPFPKGFRFAGIDISEHINQDVVVEQYDDIVDFKGFVHFPSDPHNPGFVMGFGLFCGAPWHFAGLFPVIHEAEVEQKRIGKNYLIKYGSHKIGTDDFVY